MNNLETLLSERYTNGEYMRVGFFTYKLTTFDLNLAQSSGWKMIMALVLQKSPCCLTSIHDLSKTELLISIFLGTKSYIIYYSPSIYLISLTLYCANFTIASGSTTKSIIISQSQPYLIEDYRINQGKLEKFQNLLKH